jgi:hypothetical protein
VSGPGKKATKPNFSRFLLPELAPRVFDRGSQSGDSERFIAHVAFGLEDLFGFFI